MTLPCVGGRTRAITLRRVDFPAPLRPMIDTVSPRPMLNETLLRAKNSSYAKRRLMVSIAVCFSEETRWRVRRYARETSVASTISSLLIALPPL